MWFARTIWPSRSSGVERPTRLRLSPRQAAAGGGQAHELAVVAPAELRRVQAALTLTLSIEPVTIVHDVCHIDDDAEILAILRWAALAMLHTALAGSGAAAMR